MAIEIIGLTSWLSFVVSTVSLSLSHWYPGSGVGYLIVSIPDLCTLTYFEGPAKLLVFALTLSRYLQFSLLFLSLKASITTAAEEKI